MVDPRSVSPRSQLSETIPALVELRFGIWLLDVQFPAITPLHFYIPSGLVSFSLFISAPEYIRPELTETRRWDNSAIPPTLRYVEFGHE